MKHLFKDWARIERLIKKSSRILLLADYDGTLTPIASRPKDAVLDRCMRDIVRRLSKRRKFSVGVISGRKLSDVRKLVRLDKIYYAGNHGFEIRGPGISFLHPAMRAFKVQLSRIRDDLRSHTKKIKGVIIEQKGASISLHYRLVSRSRLKELRGLFSKVCTPYLKSGRIKATSGKKVWEIRSPAKWDKGRAVDRILKLFKGRDVLPVYLGDDNTDEDAFSYLRRRRSVTVFIGSGRKGSAAEYYLNSPREVKKFLMRLCQV